MTKYISSVVQWTKKALMISTPLISFPPPGQTWALFLISLPNVKATNQSPTALKCTSWVVVKLITQTTNSHVCPMSMSMMPLETRFRRLMHSQMRGRGSVWWMMGRRLWFLEGRMVRNILMICRYWRGLNFVLIIVGAMGSVRIMFVNAT